MDFGVFWGAAVTFSARSPSQDEEQADRAPQKTTKLYNSTPDETSMGAHHQCVMADGGGLSPTSAVMCEGSLEPHSCAYGPTRRGMLVMAGPKDQMLCVCVAPWALG